MDCDIKKPQIRLKMGPSRYFSKRSDSVTGDWNEGFLFLVSYHAQLFNTVEVIDWFYNMIFFLNSFFALV